ncbi:nucleoside kinase [Isachenkonia alkalipeptolytica]|uniref:Nucleoside kinase n=1 Tax=Isachenkonia alkalipeptolytica TaxID=2565777 RepID=A0AA43XMS7_9CLOT|nr:nucleoside kinase [Isachenkonia alkalipeptolytica]NBG89164.1 nucleoside kinase [Isachenkonia alkalipeptolytica]
MENQRITLTLPNGDKKQYLQGITFEEVIKDYSNNGESIVAVLEDCKLRELTEKVEKDSEISFVDIVNPIGNRIYQRSISFVFIRAAMELFSGCKVSVEHSISKGLYCEIQYKRDLVEEDIQRIEERMSEIIAEDVPFEKEKVSVVEAKNNFEEYGQRGKVNLLKYREKPYINLYKCGWLKNYFYGYMVPSTGYLKKFRLQYYKPGMVLQFPTINNQGEVPKFIEQPKLFKIFRESEKWGEILGVDYVSSLNDLVVSKQEGKFIRIAEALHEKKIARIADEITKDLTHRKVILIAGPSSSGKTTFAERLAIQLSVNGLEPVSISLDNYFVNREKTPLDENGNYNFESLYAIDIELFNHDLKSILAGKKVSLPTFNFHTGKREYNGESIQIKKDQPIILEGIHCLNDELTKEIDPRSKYKIYISALTQLNIDEHNRIPTTDLRLIRRIVRDHKFRSNDVETSLELWKSVRKGEEENIFPFQEQADVMFNSALFYELGVLKKYIEPLLRQVDASSKYYPEIKRLLKFLNYFVVIQDEENIPKTSILREFIGGSTLH